MDNGKSEEELQEELASIKSDLSNLRGDLRDLTEKIIDRSKEAATNVGEKMRQTASDGLERAENCIRDHPVQSILVTLGAGVLFGIVTATLLRR